MKKKLKNLYVLLAVMCTLFALTACAKENRDEKKTTENGMTTEESVTTEKEPEEIPEFSSEYLLGIYYGGSSWGEYYDCISAKVVICTNHDLLVYMPTNVDGMNSVSDVQLIETLTLTDEQYANIEKALDKEKLFTMEIESDSEVCDGSSYCITLYDKNQEVAKNCGGYMPMNEEFWDIYDVIIDNIPGEEIEKIRSEQVEKLRKMDNGY